MPPIRIPLFHPRVVKERLSQHAFPADLDERHARLLRWVETLRSGALDSTKEVQLHGQFLEQVFGSVLGYRGMVQSGGTDWELVSEQTVSASGKSADGAIGYFRDGEAVVFAPIELKGARQPLDHSGNRPLTPVQQAWEYAQYTPTSRYIILSNFRETRLYARARTPDEYESFLLEDLIRPDEFRRFFLLLGRENLMPVGAPGASAQWEARSVVDDLLATSSKKEEEITATLYGEYRTLRRDLYAHLGRVHSNFPRRVLLGHTQRILDRLLFIAFAVKRGLLPDDLLEHALTTKDRYRKQPYWRNLVAVFRWIDEGNSDPPKVPAYNGGLFHSDAELEALEVGDEMSGRFLAFARHDFREEISVEVLGHIFEQSIAEFEELEAEAEASPEDSVNETNSQPRRLSKRKSEGVYYTPSFITRYIVEETLGRTLAERWQATLARVSPDIEKDEKRQDAKWILAWESYREELKGLRVLDLACGSGAFLIAAFDRLAREYERVNASVASLRGGLTLFDLTRTILNSNLFGVDVNAESVEITKLSLWLKTAQYGQRLAALDRNIKWGNSVVDDALVDPRAFDWTTGLPSASLLATPSSSEEEEIDARWRDKFDVVIGNPPYVRQELLAPYKEHWQQRFRTYAGAADLYIYFFERGLQVLKDNGRLGFIVANKWLRAEYGEGLRGLIASETGIETFVDFGHAPIFPDADTFPCVITFGKHSAPDGWTLDVTRFPREELGVATMAEYAKANHFRVPQARLGADGWSLEPEEVESLLDKIRAAGIPLADYLKSKPFSGIKTGFNPAFIIDDKNIVDRLILEDFASKEIIKPYLRGEDVSRWSPAWEGQWMIFTRRGIDIERYPAVKKYLERFRTQLEPQPANWKPTSDLKAWPGRKAGNYKWFEIQDSIDYYAMFEQPKIVYQEIQFHPSYGLDDSGMLLNNKVFFLPTNDPWLLAVLNSPLLWWHNWRYLPHMKDEALSPTGVKMEKLPICKPRDEARAAAEQSVPKLVAAVRANDKALRNMFESLRSQFGVEAPGQSLSNPVALSGPEFLDEIVVRRGKKAKKLKLSEVGALRELYEETVTPMRQRLAESRKLEQELAALVNDAYGLTPAEVELIWNTAPPRMPGGRAVTSLSSSS